MPLHDKKHMKFQDGPAIMHETDVLNFSICIMQELSFFFAWKPDETSLVEVDYNSPRTQRHTWKGRGTAQKPNKRRLKEAFSASPRDTQSPSDRSVGRARPKPPPPQWLLASARQAKGVQLKQSITSWWSWGNLGDLQGDFIYSPQLPLPSKLGGHCRKSV